MRGFERGNNALRSRKQPRRLEGGGIRNRGIFGAVLVGKPCVLGTDRGIVQSGGNGMRRGDLAVRVLQNVGIGALQHARARASEALMRCETGGVFAEPVAAPTRFDAHHSYVRVLEKFVKKTDRIRPATNARVKVSGQAPFAGKNLFASLATDDGLKVTDHRRVGMGAENGAEQVM